MLQVLSVWLIQSLGFAEPGLHTWPPHSWGGRRRGRGREGGRRKGKEEEREEGGKGGRKEEREGGGEGGRAQHSM